ncbi:MAG: DUF1440 domain-containing protein [Candidatus Eremiobacteraeota bacterium]|nr:DUF1440 domain-containing protein [Candidatus Eremiobacteraeota bacterium]
MNGRAAVAAGVAGSLAMDLVQDAFALAFERNRTEDDRDEETEAIVAVVRRLSPFVPGDFVRKHPGTAGRVLHYAFGCGFAAAYAAARDRLPRIATGRGLAFGFGLWLLSDALLIPAARLGRPWLRYSWAERLNAVASHLAYAATVDAVLQAAG